jgi:hypothetical protein
VCLDTGTLKTVIGLKKWAKDAKVKSKKDIRLQQSLEELRRRVALEIPQCIQTDLIDDCLPILNSFVDVYRKELGDKHPYTIGCSEFFPHANMDSV